MRILFLLCVVCAVAAVPDHGHRERREIEHRNYKIGGPIVTAYPRTPREYLYHISPVQTSETPPPAPSATATETPAPRSSATKTVAPSISATKDLWDTKI
uniref:Uncharacterized protein n=1 Tax=Heliothis virescens TaxID=7102 RepID=A0A2A4K4Z3_HELVI